MSGALLSTVTVFFNFVPLRIDSSSILLSSFPAGFAEKAGSVGAGGGGGGGAQDILILKRNVSINIVRKRKPSSITTECDQLKNFAAK